MKKRHDKWMLYPKAFAKKAKTSYTMKRGMASGKIFEDSVLVMSSFFLFHNMNQSSGYGTKFFTKNVTTYLAI